MTSETLAREGARGGLVVLKTAMRGGKRSGRSLVSTALTSTLHRCCAPKISRRIPTIPTGVLLGGWLVHVSAVDTGLCGSESAGFLVAEPGAVVVWNHRHSCLRPCVVCRTQPLPPGGPSHVINVMTSNIELYLASALGPGGHGSTPALPHSCPESVYSTRVGIY